jgi:methionine synthase II (cobalamin-independent)
MLQSSINRMEASVIEVDVSSVVITGGEQTKPSFVTYSIAGLSNLSPDGAVIPFVDGHIRQLPALTSGPFRYAQYAVNYFLEAKKNLPNPDRRLKQAVISASAMMLLYPADGIEGYSQGEFIDHCVAECTKDVRLCLDAGADVVQMDMTKARLSLKLDPRGGLLRTMLADNDRVFFSAFSKEEEMKLGIHVCPGADHDSTHSADVDYAELLPLLLTWLSCSRFYLELKAAETGPIKALTAIRDSMKPDHMIFVGVVDLNNLGSEIPFIQCEEDRAARNSVSDGDKTQESLFAAISQLLVSWEWLQCGDGLSTFQLSYALALLLLSALQVLFSLVSLLFSSKWFLFARLYSRTGTVTAVTLGDDSPLVAVISGYGWLERIGGLVMRNSNDKIVTNSSLPGLGRLSALAGCGCSVERKKRSFVDRSSNQQGVGFPSCSSTERSVHGITVTAGRRLVLSLLLLASSSLLLGEVSSFQHYRCRAFPRRTSQLQRVSPTSLLAKKWISLAPGKGVPRVFGIKIDDTIADVDDLKKAIKKKKANDLRHVDADNLVLEYPAGTELAEDSPISEITGGEKKSEPILARVPQTTTGPLITLVEDFKITPDETVNSHFEPSFRPREYIGLQETVDECVQLVLKYTPPPTDPSFRNPPLFISRLARSGKTTILHHLFDALKKHDDFDVISISFNGSGGTNGFERRTGETAVECIARQIALQLTDIPDGALQTQIMVDRKKLIAYLDSYSAKHPERKLVLLIDELNVLGRSIDSEAAKFLRNNFLDPKGRYLVFTTHIPLQLIDSMNAIFDDWSPRKGVTVKLRTCSNKEELQQMFEEDGEMARRSDLFTDLGIPALTFSRLRGDFDAAERVNRCFQKAQVEFGPLSDHDKFLMLKDFLNSFLIGKVSESPAISRSARLDEFSAVTSENKLTVVKRYPLGFVSPIVKQLMNSFASRRVMLRIIELIDKIIPAAFDKSRSGEDWEAVIELSVLLWCLYIQSGAQDDLVLMPDVDVKKFEYRILPDTVTALGAAKQYIETQAASMAPGTLFFVKCESSQFNILDGFLVYKISEQTLRRHAYQLKRGKYRVSDSDVENSFKGVDWLDKVFWILGKPHVNPKNPIGIVDFLNLDDLRKLLGPTLSQLNENVMEALGKAKQEKKERAKKSSKEVASLKIKPKETNGSLDQASQQCDSNKAYGH